MVPTRIYILCILIVNILASVLFYRISMAGAMLLTIRQTSFHIDMIRCNPFGIKRVEFNHVPHTTPFFGESMYTIENTCCVLRKRADAYPKSTSRLRSIYSI